MIKKHLITFEKLQLDKIQRFVKPLYPVIFRIRDKICRSRGTRWERKLFVE